MEGEPTQWVVDEQQVSFVRQVFDLTVHDEPIELGLEDIDELASRSIGQNRTEMGLDSDTVDILAMYMAEAVAMPMPLVFKKDGRAKRVIVLDGNHRINASLVKRAEPTCPAVLVTGDSQVAQRLAVVVNTQHGRTTRHGDYVATAMRMLREQGVAIPQIARMFGVTDSRVSVMTRRDAQAERLRVVLPERRAAVKQHALDMVAQLEDEHVRILGELFLDAPKQAQEEYVRRLKEAPSAVRDALAHEIVGELREIERARRKVSTTTTRPATNLMGALQRLVGVVDPTRAYFSSSDQQKAIMRANLATVMPRLASLWQRITDQPEVA